MSFNNYEITFRQKRATYRGTDFLRDGEMGRKINLATLVKETKKKKRGVSAKREELDLTQFFKKARQ